MATWLEVAGQHVSITDLRISIAFASGTRYYGTVPAGLYKGKILGVSTLRRSIGEISRGLEEGNVSIIFSDDDFEFRTLEGSEGFKNAAVTISMNCESAKGEVTELFYTARVYDWQTLPGSRFQISIQGCLKNSGMMVPDKTVELADWPNVFPDHIGLTVPILIGTVSDVGGAAGYDRELFQV